MKRLVLSGCIALVLSGCTSQRLGSSLGTLKNPYPVLGNQLVEMEKDPLLADQFNILRAAVGQTGTVDALPMREYLDAGFTLSTMYCEAFFRDADESQRRRRFGRSATNDVGTAMAAVLGLANAGQGVVTGVATGFGLADGLWRNYDDAFVVNPDLANVQSLVIAAQNNLEERTLAPDFRAPDNYRQAQRIIMQHARLCSTLGMRRLLNASTEKQMKAIEENTTKVTTKGVVQAGVAP